MLKLEVFDVVVVGSGPAGGAAALGAAEGGVSTLVVDRKKEVGKPVQCGELIPVGDELATLINPSPMICLVEDIARRTRTNETEILRLVSPTGTGYDIDFRTYIVDRAAFDNELIKRAVGYGAELRLNSFAFNADLDKGLLRLRSRGSVKAVRFKVLILAEGPFPFLAPKLGFSTTPEDLLVPVVQYVVSKRVFDRAVVEMYFSKRYCPGSYAWVIPKSSTKANIGLGVRRSFDREQAPLWTYLDRFLSGYLTRTVGSGKAEVKIESKVGGAVPVGGPPEITVIKSALIAGDSAGQVLAHVGGGVPTALIAGYLAGQTSAKHVSSGTPLSNYELAWRREIGHSLQKSLVIRRFADLIVGTDIGLEIGMRALGLKRLERLIRCDICGSLKLLMSLLRRD